MQSRDDMSESTSKRKCKNYSAAEKLNILKELENNVSISQLARQYDVDARTIRSWKRNRAKIEEVCKNDPKLQRKRQRKSPFEAVEKALVIWFEEMRLRSMPMTGPLLQEKARELAERMNMAENFAASEGWLSKWKARHGIRSLSICGEKMSADLEAANKFKENLEQNGEDDLTLAQIFNADETGLNYKMMPARTLAGAAERQASGFKQSKDRVTAMVCCNADGSLKLPLVIIGKSAKPRKLKNVSKNALPVYYTHEKSPWMDSKIFEKWFKEEFVPRVTAFLKQKKLPLKAILYLDNAPCHPSVETLVANGITASYLPPNTTSLIQPMDQGIIENLKRRYRSQLARCALNAQKTDIDIVTFLKSISIKEVIYWISDVWTAVDPAMIRKCWKKLLPARFFEDENEEETSAAETDMTDQDVLNTMRQLSDYHNITEDVVQDWIVEDYKITPMPSNDEIIQMAMEDNENQSGSENEEEVTPQEAILAADKLISFYEKNGLLTLDEFAALRKSKNIAIKLNLD